MDRNAASQIAESALKPFRALTYDALVARFLASDRPSAEWSEVTTDDERVWRVQIQCLWDDYKHSRDIRVMANVDDGQGRFLIRPVSSDFIMGPD